MTTTILTGVFTNDGRVALAKSFGKVGGNPWSWASYFRIGMGGWYTTPEGRVPKDPDPSLSNLEADGSPGNIWVQKTLTPADFLFLSPSTMQIRCLLSPMEGNDDGLGNSPRFFEVGIFDDYGTMVIYATFPEQTKAANKLLTNFVQAYF